MYSGDEQYDDEITSGLSYDQRMGREIRRNHNQFPSHGCGPLGTVECHVCHQRVDVVYAYSNATDSIRVEDHEFHPTLSRACKSIVRCTDAGRTLTRNGQWLDGSGYTPSEVAFTVALATIPGAIR